MTTDTNENDSKPLKQATPLIKYARLFTVAWVIAVLLPATVFTVMRSESLKQYAVVKAIAAADNLLAEQYQSFAGKALTRIDVEKYTNKIAVPEIKLDAVAQASEKTQKTVKALSKLGLKEADKVNETVAKLQQQVDKANKRLIESTDKIKSSLNKEVRAGLKKEIDSLMQTQIKKQLALSETSYKNLKSNAFGLTNAAERKTTAVIYGELAKNKDGIFFNAVKSVERYALAIKLAFGLVIFVVLMIPPFFVSKLAKKLSATFTQCPYCKKVFISKSNAVNILKIIKFW